MALPAPDIVEGPSEVPHNGRLVAVADGHLVEPVERLINRLALLQVNLELVRGVRSKQEGLVAWPVLPVSPGSPSGASNTGGGVVLAG
jgi:hypothetical protein